MGRKRKPESAESTTGEPATALRIADEPADETTTTTCDDSPIIDDTDWDDPASNRAATDLADAPIDPAELPPPPDAVVVDGLIDLAKGPPPSTVVDPVIDDPHSRIRGQIDAIANGAESNAKSESSPPQAAIWLREIQEQNQRVQIAFAELENAKLVAKSKKAVHDEEVGKLTKLIADQKEIQDAWATPLPLFNGANGQAKDTVNHTTVVPNSNGKTGPLTDAQISEAWKFASIAELNLPGKLPSLLEENGITTIGDLEAKRASRDGLIGIKGIGQAKVDLIENTVLDWLSVQRDAKALAAAANLDSAAQQLADDTGADVEVIASSDGQADEVIVTATANVAEQDVPPEFDDI